MDQRYADPFLLVDSEYRISTPFRKFVFLDRPFSCRFEPEAKSQRKRNGQPLRDLIKTPPSAAADNDNHRLSLSPLWSI